MIRNRWEETSSSTEAVTLMFDSRSEQVLFNTQTDNILSRVQWLNTGYELVIGFTERLKLVN
jgi:hypothetical protein